MEKGKNTLIIAGFPGIGKSMLSDHDYTYNMSIVDSDSSKFSWLETEKGKIRNPDFPNNYMEHIKSLIGIVDIICVSTHKIVRQALRDNNIKFILVYPKRNCKSIYLYNYGKRGNDDNFIDLMRDNWDTFLREIEEEKIEGSLLAKKSLDKHVYLGHISLSELFEIITEDNNDKVVLSRFELSIIVLVCILFIAILVAALTTSRRFRVAYSICIILAVLINLSISKNA